MENYWKRPLGPKEKRILFWPEEEDKRIVALYHDWFKNNLTHFGNLRRTVPKKERTKIAVKFDRYKFNGRLFPQSTLFHQYIRIVRRGEIISPMSDCWKGTKEEFDAFMLQEEGPTT